MSLCVCGGQALVSQLTCPLAYGYVPKPTSMSLLPPVGGCGWGSTTRRRLGVPMKLQCIPDADVRNLFERVRCEVTRPPAALTYLWNFVVHYNAIMRERGSTAATTVADWDLRSLNGTQEGTEVARAAWDRMVTTAGLCGQYRERVRTALSAALSVLVPALAVVIQPARRPGRSSCLHVSPSTRFLAMRSAVVREFSVQECLPLSVRRQEPTASRYRVLVKVGERLGSEALRSVSKSNMQKILLFVHRLLPKNHEGDHQQMWSTMAQWRAPDWLELYAAVTRTDPRISLTHLQRHLRILYLLHHRIFRPEDLVLIPLSVSFGRTALAQFDEDDPSAYGGSHSASSFGSSGSSEADDCMRSEHQRVRAMVGTIRLERCHQQSLALEEQVYAFTTQEIRAILLACTSTVERLMVLLLITTGVRIGGLCRLRLPSERGGVEAASICGRDIPRTLTTTEKNAATRVVVLTSAVRILIARWLREGAMDGTRGPPPQPYLFPSTRRGSEHSVSKAGVF